MSFAARPNQLAGVSKSSKHRQPKSGSYWQGESPVPREGGEGLAKRKGEIITAARRDPKEGRSKDASR